MPSVFCSRERSNLYFKFPGHSSFINMFQHRVSRNLTCSLPTCFCLNSARIVVIDTFICFFIIDISVDCIITLFLSQSVMTMLEFNMCSWWCVFLFPLIDHLFFYFEQFSLRSLFPTYLQKHSCWELEYWNLDIVQENFHVNFLDICTVLLLILRKGVFENFLKIFSSNNLVKMLFFASSSFRSWSVWGILVFSTKLSNCAIRS